jgi:hypothetical protein
MGDNARLWVSTQWTFNCGSAVLRAFDCGSCCGGNVHQGRGKREVNGLRRTGVLLSVALVAAAFASHAHAADDSGPPASPPATLVFANTASIAPDVPETSDIADPSAAVTETSVPAAPVAPVAATVVKKPVNDAGWVEVRSRSSHRVTAISPHPAAASDASTPATPPATQRAAVKRRVPQYHRHPAQYHAADVTPGRSESTSATLAPMQRHDGVLTSSDDPPSDGSPDTGDPCTSEPPICPDLCGDIPLQNSVRNVAEIVRCIVNAVTQEIGAEVPPAVPGDTSGGQYQCDDPQYQGPPCDQPPIAATPAAPPDAAPTPGAAPTATPTPTGGSTTGPSGPAGATPSGPSTTHAGSTGTSNADDGWQLVPKASERPHASRAVLAEASVPATSPREPAHVRVAAAVPRAQRVLQPPRRFAPSLRSGHPDALATAATSTAAPHSDNWLARTMILLLALGSFALVLAAVTRVNGGAAAASVRARLGSRGLSRGSGRRRGIRYRE